MIVKNNSNIFWYFLLVVVLFLPKAIMAKGDLIKEKRIKIAMRAIGHEVLSQMGDCESRVLPIDRIEGRYKIPFEFEFSFDPDYMISIIDRVMVSTKISTDYLVEIEQCKTHIVVHSFAVGQGGNPFFQPCGGRRFPEDCYQLFITLLDDPSTKSEILAQSEGDPYTATSTTNPSIAPLKPAYIILPLLLLISLLSFFLKTKGGIKENDHLIPLGIFQFDKEHQRLINNHSQVDLSNKETELLSLLYTHANEPLKRELILQEVWGDEGSYMGRTLDVFISKLRKKLDADAGLKIMTIRGVGYKLVMEK